jgi:protein-L-isoaspartate(D-aspartate) O-methyltransferase
MTSQLLRVLNCIELSSKTVSQLIKPAMLISHSGLILTCFAFICLGSAFSNRALGQAGLPQFNNYVAAREQLIREILIPGGVTDERVLSAMRETPRHEFVPQDVRAQAYYDRSLPIGSRQTISSPFIVAIMTQELDTKPEHKVLEIGTGSGFQAAVLSPLVKEVYSIEIVPELGNRAREVLTSLGYKNVTTKVGDGYKGWEEYAPFDRIIVTCSPENVPQPLVDQLVEGGLMVIPVGERYQQMLYLMRKKDGKLEREELRPTLFVPMTGTAEDQRKVKADPANPNLVNGDFEQEPLESGDMPGWYYQSGLSWQTEESKHFVEFQNEARGRPTHLLQGVALDGRLVRRVRLSAEMRLDDVKVGLETSELPAVTLRFYDERRALLETQWIGLVRGTRPWKSESRTVRVPAEAREAIVSIGLFGATGRAAFDNVALEAVKE